MSLFQEAYDLTQRFGEGPTLVRRITETSDISFTTPGGLAAFFQISLGSQYNGMYCTELQETEEGTDPDAQVFTRTLVATYRPEDNSEDPLSRPDIWTFQTQGASVPAFFYFDGSTMRPMTNSAGDWLRGPQVDEAQTKVLIKGNRATFPSAIATAITNSVNASAYLGAAPGCWKCQGISGQRRYEENNGVTVGFWEVTVELLFRQTGWNLLIPDVGYNFLEAGVRKRATVKTKDESGVEVDIASADVVALDGSGGMATGSPPVPAILTRRVYRQVEFSGYFGAPPN